MKFRKNQLQHLISQNTLTVVKWLETRNPIQAEHAIYVSYAVLRTAVPAQDSLRGKLFISAHNLSRIYRKKGRFSALLNIPTLQMVNSWSFQPFWAALSSFGFRAMASYSSLQAAFLPPACPRKYQTGTWHISVSSIIKSHLSLYLAHTNRQISKTQSCYLPLGQRALLGDWLLLMAQYLHSSSGTQGQCHLNLFKQDVTSLVLLFRFPFHRERNYLYCK